jgi:hypothetical protein
MFENKKIGFLMGSYDPIQKAHVQLAKSAVELGLCDYVFILADWTRIDDPAGMTIGYDPKVKIDIVKCNEMIRLAVANEDNIFSTQMSPLELQNLLTEADDSRADIYGYGRVKLKWNATGVGLVGSDTAKWINTYKSGNDLLPDNQKLGGCLRGVRIPEEFDRTSIASNWAMPVDRFVVGLRSGTNLPSEIDLLAKNEKPYEKPYIGDRPASFINLGAGFAEISSTVVRNAIVQCLQSGQRFEDHEDLKNCLNPLVLDYIKLNRLYTDQEIEQRNIEAIKKIPLLLTHKKYMKYLEVFKNDESIYNQDFFIRLVNEAGRIQAELDKTQDEKKIKNLKDILECTQSLISVIQNGIESLNTKKIKMLEAGTKGFGYKRSKL